MQGFRNGAGLLNELCNSNNVIAVQESCIADKMSVDKLSLINNNFNFHANSGMKEAVAKILLEAVHTPA